MRNGGEHPWLRHLMLRRRVLLLAFFPTPRTRCLLLLPSGAPLFPRPLLPGSLAPLGYTSRPPRSLTYHCRVWRPPRPPSTGFSAVLSMPGTSEEGVGLRRSHHQHCAEVGDLVQVFSGEGVPSL